MVETGPLAPARQVRYGTFLTATCDARWILCLRAEVRGEVLAIVDMDGDTETWVPLHLIRDRVEYRAFQPGGGEPE